MVTDYFKKVENLEIDHIGACVALGDWLSQMGDEQYIQKLSKLYQEFDEFQKYKLFFGFFLFSNKLSSFYQYFIFILF